MPTSFKPRFRTLVAIYEHSVESFADRPLFGTKSGGEWKWMNYRRFRELTEQARGGLASLGIGAGERVGMIANNRPEWAIAAYATYGRRGAFVPMYQSQPADEWSYILADCGAKVVVVANDAVKNALLKEKASMPELETVVVIDGTASEGAITWKELLSRGTTTPASIEHPEPSEIAGYIYTSGTTGKPKGVLLTHSNFACNVSAMHEVFPMATEDRSLSFLPWAHSFGQTVELHGLFSMGASMAIAEAVDKILANLAEVKPTLLFSVPRIFNRLYDGIRTRNADGPEWRRKVFESAMENSVLRKRLGEARRSSGVAEFKHRVFDKLVFQQVRDRFGGRLKFAFSGGAAISREVAEFIDNLGITVYEGYGLTETSPIATANWPGARRLGSVGKALPGVTIEIDKSVTHEPANGEIIVHGHNVMLGYHNLPEDNAAVFTEDGGFRTGDMGRIDEDGFLFITGRIKEQYKLENGKYVVPSPLEEKLKLSSYISNAFVYGDNKLHNVALICAAMPAVQKWAKEHGVSGSGEKVLTDPKVQALFTQEIERIGVDFKGFERIKRFKLIAEDFTTDNGMLTPKMSLKRREVMKKYGAELDALY